MLLVRPKFWIQCDDPNPDLSEAGWGYWIQLSKFNLDKLHTLSSAKSGRSSGNIQAYVRSETLRMQTYREAVLEAYLRARKKAIRLFREPAETRTDLPVEKMIDWFEQLNIEPGEYMDITHTGKYAKFIVCTFGEEGLMFPDDPANAWWPNDYNIPKPDKWKLVMDAHGEATLRTWG